MPSAHSVAFGVFSRHGSREESETTQGSTHFLEHMLFKGTKRYTAHELDSVLEDRGGALNAFTTRETLGITAQVLPEDLPLAIEVTAGLLREPLLEQRHIDLERRVIAQEILDARSDPAERAVDLAYECVYGANTPMGRPIVGTRESIAGVDRGLLLRRLAEVTRGGDTFAVAAGRTTEEHFGKLLTDLLPLEGERSAPPPVAPVSSGTRVERFGVKGLANVVWCVPVPPYAEESRYAVTVISTVLGGGSGSRLFTTLREQRAQVYDVHTFNEHYSDSGMLGVFLSTDPASATEAIRSLTETIDRFVEDGLSADELERFVKRIRGELAISQDSTSARVSWLSNAALFETGETVESAMKGFESVTTESAHRLLRERFAHERQSLCVVCPEDVYDEIDEEVSKWKR